MRRASTLCWALVLAGCGAKAPAEPTVPPGLAAVPPRLAYLCVTPGCEETQTLEIDVRGSRRVAIKRVLLSGGGSADFSFHPSETTPFIVGGGSSFTVDVKYSPVGAPSPGDAKLLVTYTDASPDESPDRLPPGELAIPLVRRIVGEPVLTVKPGHLQFGVVAVGDAGVKSVRVANEGFGNIVLEVGSVDAGGAEVTASLPAHAAMGPDAGFDLPIVYRPTAPSYVKATVSVLATASEVPPAYVTVEGTSLAGPRLQLDPAGDLDFGLVGKGKMRTISRELVNIGGADLNLASVTVVDALDDVKVVAPQVGLDGGVTTLKPLQHLPVQLLIEGADAGEVDATVIFSSNDPMTPLFGWKVKGTVTDPRVQVSPPVIDFGNVLADGGLGAVPVGWVLTRPLEIMNVGYGPLTVRNISVVAGGSNQFTLTMPTLPAMLDRGQRIGVDVQFTAATISTFSAEVSVESDDAVNPFAYAELHAGVAMCGPSTCPIANGTPSCTSGACTIGACNAGFYDTDGQASTGCECREPPGSGPDPGPFCTNKNDLGPFHDNGSGTQYTGLVALADDVDLVSFTGIDDTQFFSDDYDVKIRLDSTDPGIRMCVYRNPGRNLPMDCFFSNEVCPTDRSYRHRGSPATEDGSDYIVKVFRDPQSAPTCTPYTLFISNAR